MAAQRILTEADYFRLERMSPEKHDFLNGRIIDAQAMAGGTYGHSLVSSNLVASLKFALKGRPCRAHGSELRVGMPKGNYVFPDALVECGKPQLRDEGPSDTLMNPIAVYEVMSDSSVGYDNGPKKDAYAETLSIQEIVLIHLHSPRIDRYVRFEGGWRWEATVGLAASLRTVDVEILLSDIYADHEFPPADKP